MTPQALANIKERYEKVYILADEKQHKLLATMKEDILALIADVETTQATGIKQFNNVTDIFRSV